MNELEFHPVADLFPMLADDELAELAEDIKQRGLIQPIVLDVQGRVLDGRNRLAACRLIDVEPEFITYEGDDPDGYALAVNINRRHLTKGQQAMVAAKARLVSKQDIRSVAKQSGLNAGRVGQAATVVDHAPDLIDAVMLGAKSLDDAYKMARDRKAAAANTGAQMAQLRIDAPDLADLVAEERMSLSDALGAARARAEEAKRQRRVATQLLCDVVTSLAQANGADLGEKYDPAEASPGRALSAQSIEDAIAALAELAHTWKKRGIE